MGSVFTTDTKEILEGMAELDLRSAVKDLLRFGWTMDEIEEVIIDVQEKEVEND